MTTLIALLVACGGLTPLPVDSTSPDSTTETETDTETDEPTDDDLDDDGLSNADEGLDEDGGSIDTDSDGIPDHLDTDSDNDGLPDSVEGEGVAGPPDSDGDGVPDFRDSDSDNDSLLDQDEGIGDVDGDGIGDWRDPLNDVGPPTITLVSISTAFNSPIGIDVHDPTHTVVMSVNYSAGEPLVLERVELDGDHAPFSDLHGFTNEVKIATARIGNPGGFQPGDLFVGNGVDGQIVRVDASGASYDNPWVDLPGEGNGLMRGSLYVDRTGVFGGDLVVATTTGQVWRITSAAVPTLVAELPGVHLEGLATVPDAPVRYGPLAGTVIAGAEGQGLLYAFKPDGSWQSHSLGVNVEDIDIVTARENFFGVNFGTSKLLGAPASEFATIVGDILLTQESHSGVGLYRLFWDGSSLAAVELSIAPGSAVVAQWEHVTFANAGIREVPQETE